MPIQIAMPASLIEVAPAAGDRCRQEKKQREDAGRVSEGQRKKSSRNPANSEEKKQSGRSRGPVMEGPVMEGTEVCQGSSKDSCAGESAEFDNGKPEHGF